MNGDVTLHSLDKKIDILLYQNDEMNKKVTCLDHDINGNGKKGLKREVSDMGVYWKVLTGAITLIIIPLLIFAITKAV